MDDKTIVLKDRKHAVNILVNIIICKKNTQKQNNFICVTEDTFDLFVPTYR